MTDPEAETDKRERVADRLQDWRQAESNARNADPDTEDVVALWGRVAEARHAFHEAEASER
jgi:hypothetical protein